MGLELQPLRQVLALAEHGSFVRAAAALHISQPALSRSIQNLERRFGSELFLRSAAGVVPTDLGRLYIERARELLRLADELDHEAVAYGTLQSGRVNVGGGPYPIESFLGPAAVRFAELYPRVGMQLQARDWDDLLRLLRSRELDFFVAEFSTMQREHDLEIVPMPTPHALHFVARADHPLAAAGGVKVEEMLAWPFVTPSRIPPRVLDPLLAAKRGAARSGVAQHAFPAIQCDGLAPVKRILGSSDAISASILSCISNELASGRFVLLGTEPWLHLHYGIVSLKGRPWTQAAERFREFVLDAESIATREEEELAARFAPGRTGRSSRVGRPAGRRRRPDSPGGGQNDAC
jgi:DNA-binding transcriptional LysR family regulator